jgi:hypothetical protein
MDRWEPAKQGITGFEKSPSARCAAAGYGAESGTVRHSNHDGRRVKNAA